MYFLSFSLNKKKKQSLIERCIKQTMPAERAAAARQTKDKRNGKCSGNQKSGHFKTSGRLILILFFTVFYFVAFLLICVSFFLDSFLKYSHGIVEVAILQLKSDGGTFQTLNALHPWFRQCSA